MDSSNPIMGGGHGSSGGGAIAGGISINSAIWINAMIGVTVASIVLIFFFMLWWYYMSRPTKSRSAPQILSLCLWLLIEGLADKTKETSWGRIFWKTIKAMFLIRMVEKCLEFCGGGKRKPVKN